jgi:exodeoxyribonuclease-5
MKLSYQQQQAIDDIHRWLQDSSRQLYRLFGYAGTGKTTLAKHIAGGATLFCAFTGKAAYVLRQKGCEAFTIHQLIYCPKDRSQRKLKELEAELANTDDPAKIEELERQIEFEHKKLNSPNFVLNPDSPVKTADLIVVDECSMVNEQMACDLMSYGTKILVLGDPAQLPPVMGTGFFIKAKPDFMLTEIHRQARGNPIIDLATRVRMREELRPDGDQVVPWGSVSAKEVLDFDQILVGRNATRKATNRKIRTLLGRTRDIPEEGDRLVCLRNDHEVGLLNGAIWETESCFEGDEYLDLIVFDPECNSNYVAVEAHRHHFMSDAPTTIPWWIKKEAQEFDYGYALTVHKSQGSEWDKVLVFDESAAFGRDSHRHLYTAITRAAKQVKVVTQDVGH